MTRGKRTWKKGELRHVEIDHVGFPTEPGEPIVFNLTPRGEIERARRQVVHEKEQRKIKRDIARGDYGIPADWIVRGMGAGRYFH